MFNTDVKTRKARKWHRCTNCAGLIEPGSVYQHWVSFDDSAFANKMHPECLDALQRDADAHGEGSGWEYNLYGGERPPTTENLCKQPLPTSTPSQTGSNASTAGSCGRLSP